MSAWRSREGARAALDQAWAQLAEQRRRLAQITPSASDASPGASSPQVREEPTGAIESTAAAPPQMVVPLSAPRARSLSPTVDASPMQQRPPSLPTSRAPSIVASIPPVDCATPAAKEETPSPRGHAAPSETAGVSSSAVETPDSALGAASRPLLLSPAVRQAPAPQFDRSGHQWPRQRPRPVDLATPRVSVTSVLERVEASRRTAIVDEEAQRRHDVRFRRQVATPVRPGGLSNARPLASVLPSRASRAMSEVLDTAGDSPDQAAFGSPSRAASTAPLTADAPFSDDDRSPKLKRHWHDKFDELVTSGTPRAVKAAQLRAR